MPNDLEELEAINNAAIESIERLESSGSSRPQSFWDSDPAKKFRPSQQNISVPLFESSRKYDDPVPRRFYRPSMSSYETSGYNQMSDSFYRKMLVSVYKNTPRDKSDKTERPEVAYMNDVINVETPGIMSFSLNLMMDPEPVEISYYEDQQETTVLPGKAIAHQPVSVSMGGHRKIPAVSDHTRNQLAAIVMSGALRILTTMVLNWARDREVPYELL